MAQTVFITGANSGVGLATTRVFIKNGWNVVGTARNPEAAKDLQEIAKANEGKVLITRLDITSPSTYQSAFDAAVKRYDKVDVLINNAGYGELGAMENLSMEDYRRQFDVNLFGELCAIL